MKAITLKQPHATLVAISAKRIETRSWNTNYRGTILIHAGKAKSKQNRDLADTWMFADYLMAETMIPFKPFDLLPFGTIIGMADIIDCIPTERVTRSDDKSGKDPVIQSGGHAWTITPAEMAFGDYSPGRYAWLLANCVKFEKPIPARGNLSLWDYDPFLNAKVQEPTRKTKHSQLLSIF